MSDAATYNVEQETTALLKMLCKLKLGNSMDLAIVDLSLRVRYVFADEAFITRTSAFVEIMGVFKV